MSEHLPHILVVCDYVWGQVDRFDLPLFERSGFPCECAVVRSFYEALNVLERWATDGHAADVISVDYNKIDGRIDSISPAGRKISTGLDFIEYVMDWSSKLPNHLHPKKYFAHTSERGEHLKQAISDNPKLTGMVDVLAMQEFTDILTLNVEKPTKLRVYLNKIFNANIPVTEIALQLHGAPDKTIDISRAHEAVRDGALTPEQALGRLNQDKLYQDFSIHIELDRDEKPFQVINFKVAARGACHGYLAFDAEQMETLHRQGRKAVIVMESYTRDNALWIPRADGLALLGEGHGHLGIMAANYDIPAVMEPDRQSGVTLRIEDRHGKKTLVGMHWSSNEPVFLAEEHAPVTLGISGILYHPETYETYPVGMLGNGFLPLTGQGMDAIRIDANKAVLEWAGDACRKHGGLSIKANADTPEQIERALDMGCNGVGLLRTEHMFADKRPLEVLQRVIMGDATALAAFKNIQFQGFQDVFSILTEHEKADLPVTIRLLDAPPDQFLSPEQEAMLVQRVGTENTRGAQLALQTEGLYNTQTEALFEAVKASGFSERVEIMIPLIRTAGELRQIKSEIDKVAERYGMQGRYTFRSMIETLSAVHEAQEIAKLVDGVSFGTNDLQSEIMGGIKRTDLQAIEAWINTYKRVSLPQPFTRLLQRTGSTSIKSPFLTFSKPLIETLRQTITACRNANPEIDVSVCGHQVAGDPRAIYVCQYLGVDSISVPASGNYFYPSKILAGQAALEYPRLTPVAPQINANTTAPFAFEPK